MQQLWKYVQILSHHDIANYHRDWQGKQPVARWPVSTWEYWPNSSSFSSRPGTTLETSSLWCCHWSVTDHLWFLDRTSKQPKPWQHSMLLSDKAPPCHLPRARLSPRGSQWLPVTHRGSVTCSGGSLARWDHLGGSTCVTPEGWQLCHLSEQAFNNVQRCSKGGAYYTMEHAGRPTTAEVVALDFWNCQDIWGEHSLQCASFPGDLSKYGSDIQLIICQVIELGLDWNKVNYFHFDS